MLDIGNVFRQHKHHAINSTLMTKPAVFMKFIENFKIDARFLQFA